MHTIINIYIIFVHNNEHIFDLWLQKNKLSFQNTKKFWSKWGRT
ncbi:MAG: hypothetical protein RLZZ546_3057 [Bacteroidota bacterium]|jgi:hypothetical protein